MNTFYSHFINKASALRLASMLSLMVIFFAVGVGAAYGQIFVDKDNGSNTYNGSSATFDGGVTGPKKTIQAAIAIADEDDIISIATGDYVNDTDTVYVDKDLTFQFRNVSGVADSVEIQSLFVEDDDTLTISNSSGLFLELERLWLGTDDNSGDNVQTDDKAHLIAGTNGVKLRNAISPNRFSEIHFYDSSAVSGTLNFPANLNVFFESNDKQTLTSATIPASIGEGTFRIETDSATVLPGDLTAGGVVFNVGSSSDRAESTLLSGGDLTVNGKGDSTAIHSNFTGSLTVTSEVSNYIVNIGDTLNGSLLFNGGYEVDLRTRGSLRESAVLGDVTVSAATDTLLLKMTAGLPLLVSGDFTNNGRVDASNGVESDIRFVGSSSTLTSNVNSGSFGEISVQTTGSLTIEDNITLASTDTAFNVLSGTVSMSSVRVTLSGNGGAAHNSGTLTGGEIRTASTGASSTNRIFGVGFNNITVAHGNSGTNAGITTVSTSTDSTTFKGTLTVLKGRVSVSTKDFSPENANQSVVIVPDSIGSGSAISVTGAGTFNGLTTPKSYDLTYTGSVEGEYTIGSEWSSATRNVTIDAVGDTLLFTGGLRATNLTIDSTAFLGGNTNRGEGGMTSNDSLIISGTLTTGSNYPFRSEILSAGGDTLFINLASGIHNFASTIDTTSGDSIASAVIFNLVDGVELNVAGSPATLDAQVHSTGAATANFDSASIRGDVRVLSGTLSGNFKNADSLVIGDNATYTSGGDTLSLDGAIRNIGTLEQAATNIGIASTDTAIIAGDTTSFTTTTGAIFVNGSGDNVIQVNGATIPNLHLNGKTVVENDLFVFGTFSNSAGVRLSDTLSLSGASITITDSVYNTTGTGENTFLTLSGSTAPTVTVGNIYLDGIHLAAGANIRSNSSTAARTVTVADTFKVSGGTVSIANNNLKFVGSTGNSSALLWNGGGFSNAVTETGAVIFDGNADANGGMITSYSYSESDTLRLMSLSLIASPNSVGTNLDSIGVDSVNLEIRSNLTLGDSDSTNANQGSDLRLKSSYLTFHNGAEIVRNDSAVSIDPYEAIGVNLEGGMKFRYSGSHFNPSRDFVTDTTVITELDSLSSGTTIAVLQTRGSSGTDTLQLHDKSLTVDSLVVETGAIAGGSIKVNNVYRIESDTTKYFNTITTDTDGYTLSLGTFLPVSDSMFVSGNSIALDNSVNLEFLRKDGSTNDSSFTVEDVTFGTGSTFSIAGPGSGGDTLNITGDFDGSNLSTFTSGPSGRVVLNGSAAQSFKLPTTATDTIPFLQVNNENGVTYTGPDLIVTEDLDLDDGVFNLGGSTMRLFQGNTDQGFTKSSEDSYVANGFVVKGIQGGDAGSAQRNYVRFPLGVAGDTLYRPLDFYITSDPVDSVEFTVGHESSNPGGTLFNSDASSAGVTKYPDFYWTVQSSEQLGASFAYELHAQAEGYVLNDNNPVSTMKVIHRAAGDSSQNEWKLLSTTYNSSVTSANEPIVKATAATGGIENTQQLFTIGLGADVEYTDTLETFQLTEGGRVGLDTIRVANLDTIFTSGSDLTFSISDTGSVNAKIKGDTLLVFADTMAITDSYTESFTITADDGFTPTTALWSVQVNPSPFVKTGAVTSFTLTADTVAGNSDNYGSMSDYPTKIALTDIFGGGSDSLFYQVIDTTGGGFFEDAISPNLDSPGAFIDVTDNSVRATSAYKHGIDDTLRIYAATDTALSVANAIAIRVTDSQVFEADTFYVNFTSVQAPTLRDTIRNFDMTIYGNDTTVSAASWTDEFGTNEYALFRSSNDVGAAVVLDTLTGSDLNKFKLSPDSTGTVSFTYRATDAQGFEVSTTFNVEVLDSVVYNDSIAAFTRDAALGDTVITDLDAMFEGGDEDYTYSAAFSKDGIASASFSDDTVTITPLDSGVVTMTVTATDGNGGADSFETLLTITGTTYTPAFDSALSEIATDTVLLEGETFEFTYSATSSDSADMKFKFATGYIVPSGMSLDSTSGLLTWTPSSFGEYSVKVTAINTNNTDYTNTDEATISVISAPTFTAELGDTTVATGDTLEFTFAADVYQGGTVSTWAVDSSYAGTATITSAGKFQFIPGVTYNGDYDFTVTVTDDKGASATSSFTVNVTQTQAWGNVSGNATLDATDATLVLRHVVGLDTLPGDTLTLADVSGNGTVSSLDASLILRKVVDSDYDFPVEREGNLKAIPATGEFTLRNMSGAGEDELALNLSVDQTSGVNALTITINYDAGLNELTAIESAVPEGWMFFYNDVKEDGVIKISAAGVTELTNRDNLITLRFNTMNVEMPSSVNADVTMNEESASPLADVLLQAIPSEFTLNQNYPNPFNPTTNIKFALPQSSVVKLEVFNVLGQRVATLVNGEMNAGYHTVMFDASNLASGVYVYRINTGEHMQVKRMMLIK